MTTYVDGFLLKVPKKNIEQYRSMAEIACEVWKDHGALDYKECVLEDKTEHEHCSSFTKGLNLKDDEVAVFAYITYNSRAHRDEVNKKVMADKRLEESCKEGNMPFNPQNMMYGGFETIVEF